MRAGDPGVAATGAAFGAQGGRLRDLRADINVAGYLARKPEGAHRA
jgi:hypothetical protein